MLFNSRRALPGWKCTRSGLVDGMWSQDASSSCHTDGPPDRWRGFDVSAGAEDGAPMASANLLEGLMRCEVPGSTGSPDYLPPATRDCQANGPAVVFPTSVFADPSSRGRVDVSNDFFVPISRDKQWLGTSDDPHLELPSTSVMVKIEDKEIQRRSPVPERSIAVGGFALRDGDLRGCDLGANEGADTDETTRELGPGVCAQPSGPQHDNIVRQTDTSSLSSGDPPQHYPDEGVRELCAYPDVQRQENKSMSLSAYLIRKNEQQAAHLVDEASFEEKHREQLASKQRQIMRLATELDEKEDKIQELIADDKVWKDKVSQLESQLQHLHGVIAEKETKADQEAKARNQQTRELAQLRDKYQSLQDANEDLQREAKKAATERDRAQKDYSQVVYDLGKAHKQLNTMSQEKVSVEEKDFLVREIEKLQTDNEQLREKLKSTEANRASSTPSSQDRQQTLQFQMHIRELEDEVRRLRCSSVSSMQPPPPPAVSARMPNPEEDYDSHFQTTHDSSYSREPAGLHAATGNRGIKTGRSMTLKDILSAQSNSGTVNTNSYLTRQHRGDTSPIRTGVLSSMGFPGRNATTPLSSSQDWMRRSENSVGSLLQYDLANEGRAKYDTSAAHYQSADTALGAPFATEKQPFLTDAVQRRQLEQDLMNFHVEKEQLESRLAKVEQGGLKTMSARMEKTRLEDHVRSLSLDISKLKMRLRQ